MSGKNFEKDRQDFIESSSKAYHPYAWEMDGHPAMRRTSLRRMRHPWSYTKADWIKSLVVLTVMLGLFFLALWLYIPRAG